MSLEPNFFNERDDQMWADLLSPGRRALLGGGAAALAALGLARGAQAQTVPVAAPASAMPGRNPWG